MCRFHHIVPPLVYCYFDLLYVIGIVPLSSVMPTQLHGEGRERVAAGGGRQQDCGEMRDV